MNDSPPDAASFSRFTQAEPHAHLDPRKTLLLFNASKALASTTDLDNLLEVIVGEVQTVLNCGGAGVLLYDTEKDDFFWRKVRDTGSLLVAAREDIRIPKDKGVCGWVFETGEPALVHDAASDPRLYRPVETKSGFTTKNMICVPLKTRDKRLGVLYALNKEDSFTDDDVEIMVALSTSVALALENAAYYESLASSHRELERLNRVKDKVLNHLSHELKTPIAIMEASLRILERRVLAEGNATKKLPFDRIYRGIDRLKVLERHVADIVEGRGYAEQQALTWLLDDLLDLTEIQEDEEPAFHEAIEGIRSRILALFPSSIPEVPRCSVQSVLNDLEFQIKKEAQERILDVEFAPPDSATLKIQPRILRSVIGGLIRNAIENTPDHGKVLITARNYPTGYVLTVQDYGVGIPETEQDNVFEGFYPLKAIDVYSSGRRFAFNAGGTGTDLLRISVFSKRLGFDVKFVSSRCTCIPSAADLCPGDITKCACCTTVDDCLVNGGTSFTLLFPPELVEPV